VVSRQFAGHAGAGFGVAVANVAGHFEGVDINGVEALFHGCVVDLVLRVVEVSGIPGETALHFRRRDHPDRFF
jgi:hypothetical protein